MDRRLFLAGLFGVAGATALAAVARPVEALAGVPGGSGILDALDDPVANDLDASPETVEPESVQYRRDRRYYRRDRRYYRRDRRIRRRRERRWNTVCERQWYRGRMRRRCYRRRTSVWIYL